MVRQGVGRLHRPSLERGLRPRFIPQERGAPAVPEPTPRRKKSERRQRHRIVKARVNADEAAAFDANQAAAGYRTEADYIRARTINAKARPQRPRIDVEAVLKVEAAIHKIGVNVNQLAARANMKDDATAAQVAMARAALERVYTLVDALHPRS